MKRFGLILTFTLLINAAFTLLLFQELKTDLKEGLAQEAAFPVEFVNFKEPVTNVSPSVQSTLMSEDFVTTTSRVTPAVVNITTVGSRGYRVSGGSGVILFSDGYIITNHHVIEDGIDFQVTLNNKRTYEAKLIGSDKTTDLALIKINASGLPTLKYGNSDSVQPGEWVLAVGNPFNLSSTVTAGIVSAKARNINILEGQYSIESFIQTDAVVNPGNSGGALVNARGDLVGINTAIISESGGYEGYSFAIPSNLVKKVIRDLQEYGKVQRAILGVSIADVDNRIAENLSLASIEGVYVREVYAQSSAAKADLRAKDVIIGINGTKTSSVPELQEQVALFRPGDSITLDIIRNGRKMRKYDVILKNIRNSN